MGAELVHYSVTDAIAEITLDRAPVNALSMPLIDALLEALGKARDDPSARAVVVASAHKVVLRRARSRHRARQTRH
jgi:enoyl-CoA hydratase/carnithine racemase